MGNSTVKASLITTVFNEEDSIEAFLESIKNQTKKPDEIIIVDANSKDKTKEKINSFLSKNKKLKIKLLIRKGNRSIGRNEGISKAKNKIIAVTDAGCILDKKWFEEILNPFKDKNIDVSSGFYTPVSKNIFQKSLATYTSTMKDKLTKDFLPSSRSVAFKKEAWKKVKGYPENLDTCEDLIFDINLKKEGFNFYLAKKAIVYWPQRKNIYEAFNQFYNYALGDGMAHHFRKNSPFLFFRVLLFLIFAILSFQSVSVFYFLILLVILYLIWSVNKNYRYVKNIKAFYYLPLLQITSDIAVTIGNIKGYLNSFNKN